MELLRKAAHLLLERLIVLLRFFSPHVAPGREDVLVLADLLQGGRAPPSRFVFVFALLVAPGVVGLRHLLDLLR